MLKTKDLRRKSDRLLAPPNLLCQLRVMRQALQRGRIEHRFLLTSDGFEMYEWAAKELLLGVCIYRLSLGTQAELEEALFHSEDSSTLNTSLVERHNLTIRQGCSYLGRRRTPCHAHRTEFLEGQVVLLMAYYNFLRPHRALLPGRIHQPGGVLSILLDAYCRTVP